MTADVMVLSAADVAALFDPETAVESQRAAFEALGKGTAVQPDKLMLPAADDGAVAFCYAARLSTADPAVSKFGSVTPANAAAGLPTIAALVVVLDAVTGQPAAVMDGTVITTRRTAAASAVAIDALARADAAELAVVGCGVQGHEHVRMLARIRPFRAVRLWGRSERRRTAAARDLAAETGLPVRASATAREAVAGADIVVLCTLSTEPLVERGWLAPGATVVSLGSIAPGRCEVGPDVVAAARVVVDDPATAAAHAGPIVAGLHAGTLLRDQLVGLGDVLVGTTPGRTAPDELVFYNSTGLGVQDAAAAAAVLERARRAGLGHRLPLTGS
ncbi:ornithine cyclodeaminase family protein [Jiangella ureilytica]|uniref:Ornithine cyclodeaminase family protein n=1 Tax=Jiangella ureilytica TaxID=2530374 RepID=A0A4R4RXB6_9ACTN|nr:ornithine cyclodeaminase family protein [Jiangella ureilytica]TDC53273.1 ornithine cyclodeaminase family protein [Jiangella ureilytica]